jgi:hypothetical protein
MKSLSVVELEKYLKNLKKFIPEADYNNMRVVIGDDDEMNGIHIAWGYNLIIKDEHEFDYWLESAHSGAEKVMQENKYTLFLG